MLNFIGKTFLFILVWGLIGALTISIIAAPVAVFYGIICLAIKFDIIMRVVFISSILGMIFLCIVLHPFKKEPYVEPESDEYNQ